MRSRATALSEMGVAMREIMDTTGNSRTTVPPDVIAESRIAEKTAVRTNELSRFGTQSAHACPDCGGPLWDIEGDIIKRYRCHIGHAYSENDLVLKQAKTAGTTLWVALRMMEERKHLLRKLELKSNEKRLFSNGSR